MSNPYALMKTPKLALIGGHLQLVQLTEYSPENDTYWGLATRCRSMDTKDKVPVQTAVPGLRPYPFQERPDYAFQFVEVDADTTPLFEIAKRNAGPHLDTLAEQPVQDRIDQINNPDPTAEMTPKQLKQWRKDHPGEGR
jgi:hypothetical protein